MSVMQEPSSTSKSASSKKRTRQEQLPFCGVRKRRWGSYVSEIRLPGQKTRIWLGSFGSPEMAARAHDSAALFLKGNSAVLNFPDSAGSLPRPESCSRRDIQLAAAKAAVQNHQETNKSSCNQVESGAEPGCGGDWSETTLFEEVERNPLMSPPRFDSDVGELYCFMDDDMFMVESLF
ncbi:hypothetical protein ACOSQ3_009128 [Xanthoceras sorbifolium]